jgi:VanZ family protein
MMKHIIWFWLPPIGYMVAIFSVSNLPNPQIGGDMPDYVLHTLEYLLLALLLIRLFLTNPLRQISAKLSITWRQACLLGMLLAMAYGITDEIHQYFIPGRHCSLHDVFADAFGSALAYGIAVIDISILSRSASWRHYLRSFPRLYALSYKAYLR